MTHYHVTDCKWLPANHFLFQLANICLVISYFVPDTMNGLFMLRCSLGSSGLFFALWGWLILCAPDTFIWNIAFMVFNYAHFIYLLVKIKRPRKFSTECETVFVELFEPLGVQRYQFHSLAKKSFVLKLNSEATFAKTDTPVNETSILLSGSINVIKDKQILHVIKPYEFVNSPEYAVAESGETAMYGVSLVVRDSAVCLSWDSGTLRKILKKDRFLTNVFNSVIGQDVTRKLLRLNDNLADLLTEDIAKYRTGSIVYLHNTAANIDVDSDGHAHMSQHHASKLVYGYSPQQQKAPKMINHTSPHTEKTPPNDYTPLLRPLQPLLTQQKLPVLDISQIGTAMRPNHSTDDEVALLSSTAVSSTNTPSFNDPDMLQKAVRSLPMFLWPDENENEIVKETRL
eukprot:gene17687-19455_t